VSTTNLDGILDNGRYTATGGPDDLHKYATPSLRNVSAVGPYFHNATVQTLTDVVNLYNSIGSSTQVTNSGLKEEMLVPINLSAAEVSDLVAFLGALTTTTDFTRIPGLKPPSASELQPQTPSSRSFPLNTVVLLSGETLKLAGVSISFVQAPFNGGTGSTIAFTDLENKVVWSTPSWAQDCTLGGCQLAFQSDGNLVATYNGSTVLWATNTANSEIPIAATKLIVGNVDPYFQVESSNGSILWSSPTLGTSWRYRNLILNQGQFAFFGPWNNGYSMIMQDDGNLVVYPGYFQSGISANPVWSTGTVGQSCTGACLAVFQGDGNFVLYNGNTPYWATSTAEGEVSDPGAELQLVSLSPWVEVLNQQGSVSWHQ
jgi:hypothetical protein